MQDLPILQARVPHTHTSHNFPRLLVNMSCPEIVHLYNAIRTDTNLRMGDYIAKLQSRYGDPRVYQAQQQEMLQEQAAVMHAGSRRKETILEDAYNAQVMKNRKTHEERLKSLTLERSKRLGSQGPARRSRTPKLGQPDLSVPAPDPSSQ